MSIESSVSVHTKRTCSDYSLAFKLGVVDEVEKGQLSYKEAQRKYGIQGRSTVLVWLRKHGSLDWQTNGMKGKKTPQQQIKELEKKIKRLEAEKLILNTAIDIADQMFDTEIRKKCLPLSEAASREQGQDQGSSSQQSS